MKRYQISIQTKGNLRLIYGSTSNVNSFLIIEITTYVVFSFSYSIVKDRNADLRVIFKFFQNLPIIKSVCTKISKKHFCIFVNILIFLRECFAILNI